MAETGARWGTVRACVGEQTRPSGEVQGQDGTEEDEDGTDLLPLAPAPILYWVVGDETLVLRWLRVLAGVDTLYYLLYLPLYI